MADKKDCSTCVYRCMDMDLEPYCGAPKVREKHPYGLVLYSGAPQECLVEGEHTLWEKDFRSQR